MSIEPYEIGKYYRVPTVLAPLFADMKLFRLPVIGPWHEDSEIIGFEDFHYHIDTRFVEQRIIDRFYYNTLLSVVLINVRGYELRRRKCRREPLDFPTKRAAWHPELQAKYAGHEINSANPVCPHRGTSLKGLRVRDGCVTCPLHGLKLKVKGAPR